MLYKLWSQGHGPRFYYVGTVRRITEELGSNGSVNLRPKPPRAGGRERR